MSRIITKDELLEEGRQLTLRCTGCQLWIRYVRPEVIQNNEERRRYVVCPGCGHERCVAIWSENARPPQP